MMLVYSLPQTRAIFDRFGGINGSAYLIGGLGMTALTANNIVVVPIRTGSVCGLEPISATSSSLTVPPGIRSETDQARAALAFSDCTLLAAVMDRRRTGRILRGGN